MCYSSITTLEIWVYIEKVVVLSDISNSNTSIFKIIELKRPVNEWAEIALSATQNDENEHCETHKKLVHKWNIHHLKCSYMTLNVLFDFYYSSNQSLQFRKKWSLQIFLIPISKIIDLIRPLYEWSEKAFSSRQNAENEHCGTLNKLVHKWNFHH